MPISRTRLLNCPSCGCEAEFSVVYNVDADNQPERRAAIVDGSFQRKTCIQCGTNFRMPPDFNYVDAGRGQWIGALPKAKSTDANGCEARARGFFKDLHGAEAPEHSLAQAAGLTARITFGWAALKEKIVAAESQLNDVVLELWKVELLRNSQTPEQGRTEFRLHEIDGDDLVMAWIDESDQVVETVRYPRSAFSEFNQNAVNHSELPERFAGVLFVDRARLKADEL